MNPTKDTLRVQEAKLKHSIAEAIKNYYELTGCYPALNITMPGGVKVKHIVVDLPENIILESKQNVSTKKNIR